jgi:hypothetical protein
MDLRGSPSGEDAVVQQRTETLRRNVDALDFDFSGEAPMSDDRLELWYWIIPSDAYPFKRHKSTWRMTEEEASLRYGSAAEKVEESREVRRLPRPGRIPVTAPRSDTAAPS